MPRRRPNPKKAKGAKRGGDKSQPVPLATTGSFARQKLFSEVVAKNILREVAQSCPELSGDALNEKFWVEESADCRLDLSGCSMTALPPSISTLRATKLVTISLSACPNLTSLPDEIGELKTLNFLTLAGCSSFVALPDAIGGLEALQLLDLGYCSELRKIPSTIGGLKALKTLCLNECTSLGALPDTINTLEALENLYLGGASSLVLSPHALDGLGALKVLIVARCDKIGELSLGGCTDLDAIDMQNTPNIGFGTSTILMLHKQKVTLIGSKSAPREMMRELRNKAKRRRQRRLCDYCGRQGGIDEPRLPVCYCGLRRYCDETCQRAGWAAEHSKTCLFGDYLTAEQIALLRRLEECYLHGLYDDVLYSYYREEYLKMTPAEARDQFEQARQEGFFPDDSFDGICYAALPFS